VLITFDETSSDSKLKLLIEVSGENATEYLRTMIETAEILLRVCLCLSFFSFWLNFYSRIDAGMVRECEIRATGAVLL
jgi:hypothetical protein